MLCAHNWSHGQTGAPPSFAHLWKATILKNIKNRDPRARLRGRDYDSGLMDTGLLGNNANGELLRQAAGEYVVRFAYN